MYLIGLHKWLPKVAVYGQGNLQYGQLHFLTQMDLCTLALEFQKNTKQQPNNGDSMHTDLHLQSNVSNGHSRCSCYECITVNTVLDEKSCGTINLYCKSCLYKAKYASIANFMHLEDLFMDLNANINDLLAPNKISSQTAYVPSVGNPD